MSWFAIPKEIGALGSAGEVAAAATDARAAYMGGLDEPKHVASMGAALVAAWATAVQMLDRSHPLLRGLAIGAAPAAAVTQATMSLVSLKTAETSAERFAASLGLLAGVSGTLAALPFVPPPVRVAMLGLSITASAAQALVLANQPLGQELLDALDAGNQALSRFFYTRPGERPIDDVERQTQTASTVPSPIILDLDGDGIETVGLASGAWFDHAGDGFAERTGWVGRDDALLVQDLDGNGRIDSGRELFGSETLLAHGARAAHGFAALAELDANGDRRIDASDPAFARLRVWQDADGNGHSDAAELRSLDQAGVQGIDVAYANSNHVDANGNQHRQLGRYTGTDGQRRAATDVWFQTDATHSVPTQWAQVPTDIAALPDAQGYGRVRDLQHAMAANAGRWSMAA